MYSKTAAILMLLGFCSGASNLEISSTGTLENHAGEISVADAERPVAQASTYLVEETKFFDTLVVDGILAALLGGSLIFLLGVIIGQEIFSLKKLNLLLNQWMDTSRSTLSITIGLLFTYCVISISFAILYSNREQSTIVLWICAGVSGVMVLCWPSYMLLLCYQNWANKY